jgi:hypothetical protein
MTDSGFEQGAEPKAYLLGLLRHGYIEDVLPGLDAMHGMVSDPDICFNLNSSPQRHRGTEKVKESMACRFDTNHPTGECMKHGKHLFFLCVLCASVVQLRF